MKVEDIIRVKMVERKMKQSELAEVAGYKHQTNISGLLNKSSHGMRMDNALRMLNALGCDIVVRDRITGNDLTID